MKNDSIQYERSGSIATLWLNRPDVRNAYDVTMLRDLSSSIRRAEADVDVAAIVLRGRGDSFCAGADLALLDGGHSWLELSSFVARIFHRLADARKVTIAALHGWAVAGGFELMLACDLAVAAEDSRIGDLHIRNGLYAGAGTIYRLPRLVGLRRARELMLSGDVLDGRQALEWGLVNAVAPLEGLEELIERFSDRFTGKSPTVARLTKLALNRGLDADLETLTVLETMTSGAIAATDDAREGLAAFRERRSPIWGHLSSSPDEDDL
jgi:enoyl-CoA hydratase/carnithine racemase